jgi:hypothetical protein
MSDILYPSSGILHYFHGPDEEGQDSYKLTLTVDPGIVKFYRSLIPKSIKHNQPLHDPHISIIRKEIPPDLTAWERYEGEEVEFFYSPIICPLPGTEESVYLWLNAYCLRLEAIRDELGFNLQPPHPSHSVYPPPPPYTRKWHITIANKKVQP